ncbi:MAG: ABC transporter substrate-binding protein, partial [Litorivicinus sp.]
MPRNKIAAAILAAAVIAPLASAETLRWARSGDSLTLDPHAQNEGTTHTVAHQIYEPLLHRDMAGQIVPALATSWATVPGNPNVWRFTLREGVTFHGGEAFTADDVVFSIKRAKMESSDMKGLLTSVKDVRAVDDLTVDIETNGANPLLINNLTNLFIMDRGWSEANDSAT